MAIEFEGLDELLKRFDNLADTTRFDSALGDACAIVERAAKQKAPKGEGELRGSITSKIENHEGIIFTPLFYAPFVEYGTGIFAENGKGRQEVPWVYIEGSSNGTNSKKTVYPSLEEAEQAAAYLRAEKGLDAVVTYGMKPTPYMRPALNENREKILRIFGESLSND